MYGKLAGLTVGTTPATAASKSQMTPLKKEHVSESRESQRRGSTLSHLVPQKTSRS